MFHSFGRAGRTEADRTEVIDLTSLTPYPSASPAHGWPGEGSGLKKSLLLRNLRVETVSKDT